MRKIDKYLHIMLKEPNKSTKIWNEIFKGWAYAIYKKKEKIQSKFHHGEGIGHTYISLWEQSKFQQSEMHCNAMQAQQAYPQIFWNFLITLLIN